MTAREAFDYIKALLSEALDGKRPCVDDEIAASDQRITEKWRQAMDIVSDPNCPKDALEAATVCLNSMSLNIKKERGTDA